MRDEALPKEYSYFWWFQTVPSTGLSRVLQHSNPVSSIYARVIWIKGTPNRAIRASLKTGTPCVYHDPSVDDVASMARLSMARCRWPAVGEDRPERKLRLRSQLTEVIRCCQQREDRGREPGPERRIIEIYWTLERGVGEVWAGQCALRRIGAQRSSFWAENLLALCACIRMSWPWFYLE